MAFNDSDDDEDDSKPVYYRVQEENQFPRVVSKEVVMIPEGSLENNELGFYLDANYSSIENEYGEHFLEVDMTLHHGDRP